MHVLLQYSIATLLGHYLDTCSYNTVPIIIAMLCCIKSRHCESSHVTSPLVAFIFATRAISMWRAPSGDVHVAKVCLLPELETL